MGSRKEGEHRSGRSRPVDGRRWEVVGLAVGMMESGGGVEMYR